MTQRLRPLRGPRSVRKRILLLVAVPMLSLLGLYAFTTTITARQALNLYRAGAIKDVVATPVGDFTQQIDQERLYAAIYLAAPNTPAALKNWQEQAARTAGMFTSLTAVLTSGSTTNNASPSEESAVATLLAKAGDLASLRSKIAGHQVTLMQALNQYSGVITDGYQVLNQVILQETNTPVVAQALALVRMGRSGEELQLENIAFTVSALTQKYTATDKLQFTQLVGARRALFSQNLSDLNGNYRIFYQTDIPKSSTGLLESMENRIVDSRPGTQLLPMMRSWDTAVTGFGKGLSEAGNEAGNALASRSASQAENTYSLLAIGGGIGLLAVAVSILVGLLIGRRLFRELASLRHSALEVADEHIPEMADRLAAGQDVRLPAEVRESANTSDEIEQLKAAFSKMHRTAVEAAVGQARLREGINDLFQNLARRSQALLLRQLALLDSLERKASPQELESLFRIDHLTTRMRRHAESLIVLSGRSPARGWRNPVPLMDVLRAAAAEVEDYTRIKVVSASNAALHGSAVADAIHMIAELAENATAFSPANAPVVITGELVGRGFAVEIDDRGNGLSEETLAQINHRLANPVMLDPSVSDKLGLFVAGQLAKRHGIRVSLHPSRYGGITAIVLIPHNLVIPDGAAHLALPPGSSQTQPAASGGPGGAPRRPEMPEGRPQGAPPTVGPRPVQRVPAPQRVPGATLGNQPHRVPGATLGNPPHRVPSATGNPPQRVPGAPAGNPPQRTPATTDNGPQRRPEPDGGMPPQRQPVPPRNGMPQRDAAATDNGAPRREVDVFSRAVREPATPRNGMPAREPAGPGKGPDERGAQLAGAGAGAGADTSPSLPRAYIPQASTSVASAPPGPAVSDDTDLEGLPRRTRQASQGESMRQASLAERLSRQSSSSSSAAGPAEPAPGPAQPAIAPPGATRSVFEPAKPLPSQAAPPMRPRPAPVPGPPMPSGAPSGPAPTASGPPPARGAAPPTAAPGAPPAAAARALPSVPPRNAAPQDPAGARSSPDHTVTSSSAPPRAATQGPPQPSTPPSQAEQQDSTPLSAPLPSAAPWGSLPVQPGAPQPVFERASSPAGYVPPPYYSPPSAPLATPEAAPGKPPKSLPGKRSPEEAGAIVSAMQQGWERARSLFGQSAAGRPQQPDPRPDGPGAPAPPPQADPEARTPSPE